MALSLFAVHFHGLKPKFLWLSALKHELQRVRNAALFGSFGVWSCANAPGLRLCQSCKMNLSKLIPLTFHSSSALSRKPRDFQLVSTSKAHFCIRAEVGTLIGFSFFNLPCHYLTLFLQLLVFWRSPATLAQTPGVLKRSAWLQPRIGNEDLLKESPEGISPFRHAPPPSGMHPPPSGMHPPPSGMPPTSECSRLAPASHPVRSVAGLPLPATQFGV
jgi:hypothetical protein